MILAGDVGGTKVDLALYGFEQGKLIPVTERKYAAKDYSSLDAVVRAFLTEAKPPDAITSACFGVPGPVRNGRLKLTNLPWVLDSRILSHDLEIDHLFLINDLEANGYGIPELLPEKIFTLSQGDPSVAGNRGLIAAGTGLGEAVLAWDGKTHLPMASEGGHVDFAPRTDEEIDLLRYLRKKLDGRVSYERVVSGIGMANVYEFFRDDKGMTETPDLQHRMSTEDPNAVIGELAETGGSELCVRTMDLFVSLYGAEAGNLALKVLAVGGIYVGGGIAPKILNRLKQGEFMRSFADKGRMSALLEKMPVHVILESRAALIGAASYAEAKATELGGHSARAASLNFTTSLS